MRAPGHAMVPGHALILAAGLGIRLRPLTDRMPKALIDVGGRPMIEYPLRMLAAAGVETVVVNLHHEGDQIRRALGDGRRYGVRLLYSPEDPILDTGGAMVQARPLLGSGAFLVVNCDALLDVDLAALAAFHRERDALATLVVRSDPEAERYGPIDLDPAMRIRRFLGKPAGIEPASDRESAEGALERKMFCGVHVISPRIFDFMPAAGVFSITRDTYAGAHRAGAPLYGFSYEGYWRDLGTQASLDAAHADLASGRFFPSYL
ncbi:MAG: nucleotidyltransferase family protein [Candidatus Binatia bacterium]